MKKYVYFLLIVLLCVFGLFACSDSFSSLFEEDESVADWDGTTTTWSYNSNDNNGIFMQKLPSNVRTVNLNLNAAADIFMVKMNPSEDIVPGKATQFLVSAYAQSAESSATANDSVALLPNIPMRRDFAPAKDFVPPQIDFFATRSTSSPEPLKSVSPLASVVADSTTKALWVDVPTSAGGNYSEQKQVSGVQYTKRQATCRYSGSYCYVWVLDDYFSDTSDSSGKKITSTVASQIGQTFDGIYKYVQHIFGEESNHMIGSSAVIEMNDKKVNIVVYDIEGDYQNSADGGTYGYFWAKDYYETSASNDSVIKMSNEGKYFYVDSYFANKDTLTLYSTLAHEFQHMINFGVKTLNPVIEGRSNEMQLSETWSNEMCSMLCEDMMQQKIEAIADSDMKTENTPRGRLPYLCAGYVSSGIIDWLSGNDVLYSYGGAYGFGAYLARNYGGPALVKEIATNDYVDQKSITEALQSLGKDETFDSVFRKYARSLVLDKDEEITFNKNVSLSEPYDGYNYPMPEINIFNVTYPISETQSLSGPALLYPDNRGQIDLRPYGFTLHLIGSTSRSSSIDLTFSSPESDTAEVYILIQPHNQERFTLQ